MEHQSSLADLNADIFPILVDGLLDEEDPALLSISNKNIVITRKHIPEMLEPPNNTKGFNRHIIGYHSLLQLRSVCKIYKERIDKLDLVSIRKQLKDFFSQKVASHPHKSFITLGIQSELQIAELKQKWPRILCYYLTRSNEENRRKTIENAMNSLYARAKFVYNERNEDHNGAIYGKASLLELEFIGQDNDPMKIQVKLVHCFDPRQANWNTQIFVYALNSKHPANIFNFSAGKRLHSDPVNCLMQVWKERSKLDLAYFNPYLAQSICKDLSLDTDLWIDADQCLLLDFFLLVAGESKFTQFVPLAMKNDRREIFTLTFDAEMPFEKNRTPEANWAESLAVVDEFKHKFLGTKIPKGKQGQRYLLNAKIQLGVSNLEANVMKSDLKIVPFLDSISVCNYHVISAGAYGYICAFNLKATIKTNNGGLFVIWAIEKVGDLLNGYAALIVMPLNQISAHSLGVEIEQQAVVYYNFCYAQYVNNKELFGKLLKHWPIVFEDGNKSEENSSYAAPDGDSKKRKALHEPDDPNIQTKKARKMSPEKDSPEPEPKLVEMFTELLKIRSHMPKRMGAFEGPQFPEYEWPEDTGSVFDLLRKDRL